jgi:hypothetical protein
MGATDVSGTLSGLTAPTPGPGERGRFRGAEPRATPGSAAIGVEVDFDQEQPAWLRAEATAPA